MKQFTAAQVAEEIDGTVIGAGDPVVAGVSGLGEAEAEHVSFLGNPKYRSQVASSKAGVVLVPPGFDEPPPAGRVWIQCADPSHAFTRMVLAFAPPPIEFPAGAHPAAVVDASASLHPSVHVGANAVIAAGAAIGAGGIVEAAAYIGHETVIGEHCHFHPNVTIRERCRLGDRVVVHSGSVVGSDGFGFEPGKDHRERVPQVGIVQIDDNVDIGACVTIDRARFGRTWIQRGVKIDNLVQIAHNVEIGEGSIIISQVGIAGSAKVGKNVIMAGQSGVPGHAVIGDGAIVMAKSGPYGNVAAGAMVAGIPAIPRREFLKQAALSRKLPELNALVRRLEEEIEQLKQRLDA